MPYTTRPDHCFWRREVANVKPSLVSPFINPKFKLDPETKVGTAGSCFAQNISRYMSKHDFNYFVVEKAPKAFQYYSDEIVRGMNYGVYSARYGNIYTTRQLKQLLQECFEGRTPMEPVWRRGDRFVDPLRPTINPSGALRESDVVESRRSHMDAVRRLFTELDVFVFTLGLTEGWQSNLDGTVLPVVPGTKAGGEFDESRYTFFNQAYPEVLSDLEAAWGIIKKVNPNARMILTVSPVPLVATMEDQSVLTSTGYSKATLRAVAGDMEKQHDDVSYFPSYEIITGAFNRGAYFAEDLRSVREEGVRHAMRVFFQSFTDLPTQKLAPQKDGILTDVEPGSIVLGAPVQLDSDGEETAETQQSARDPEDDFVDLVCEELLNDSE